MRIIYTFLLTSFLVFSFIQKNFAQGSQTTFGKNRVQFHNDFKEWLQYETPNFITFWYGEGRNIGQAVVQMAEQDYNEIQSILEHRINDRIEIIVYTDLTDLKQTNIGSEEAFINASGQTKIVGNKIFVFFNGDHNDLRRQIREGIAMVYMNAMLFGSNLQEIVQNAVMMNLPKWYKEGLVAYVGKDWSTTLDNQLRDIILSEEYNNFEDFSEENPSLAGHSLWYFISQNYGKSTVSNLLYLTRINRSIESGFLYVLGSSYNKTVQNWAKYFEQRYKSEVEGMTVPEKGLIEIKNKRNLPLTQLKISPDGQKFAYVSNEIGRYKVYIQDLNTGERKVIHKGGFRNAFQATDYAYPLLAWNPNNMEFAVLFEKRDIPRLLKYDLKTKEKVTEDLSTEYQRVNSIDYINANDMVFSATVKGFSDIFIYKTRTRQTTRVTNDFYDDLDAVMVKVDNQKGILFSSNRQDSMIYNQRLDTILPLATFDIFYYDLDKNTKELVRVTNTPLANERQAAAIDTTHFSFLSDESGIYNRKVAHLEDVLVYYDKVVNLKDGSELIFHRDSSLTSIDSTSIDSVFLRPVIKKKAFSHNSTNYNRNILTQDISNTNKVIETIYSDGHFQFYLNDLDVERKTIPALTRYQEQSFKSYPLGVGESFLKSENTNDSSNLLEQVDKEPIDVSGIPQEKQDTGKIDLDNYLFQSDFDDEEIPTTTILIDEDEEDDSVTFQNTSIAESPTVEASKVIHFRPSRIRPYSLKFRTDFVTTRMDNSLLFGGLDGYTGDQQEYSYPPPGILLKANFKDLFEDYQVEGGIRLPTTFNGAEYFLIFDNKKKRLDKRFAFYRRALRFNGEPLAISLPASRTREIVFLGQAEVRYPLDIFTSIRARLTIRQDKKHQLLTDEKALDIPTQKNQRAGLKVEYVFDNTLDVAPNLKNGTRYKIFAEVVKRFTIDVVDEFSFQFGDGFMTVLGLDARHYQRLDKHSVFAVRAVAASSFGSEKVLYYLGGVDGWLFPSTNPEGPVPFSENYAYQTLASNMRGFRQNIRNGNSYALFNAELRIPIFNYFSKRLRSSFLRNFQVVGFFDVGTAWEGKTPFSKENPLNTVIIEESKVTIKVNYFRDPIVAGYGFGVRSMLFGYFVKLDYAWGLETKIVQDPVIYLSLGMDF